MINFKEKTTMKMPKRASGGIIYSEGGMGKTTFLSDAVNSYKNGLLFLVGHNGTGTLDKPCNTYNEILCSSSDISGQIADFSAFQDVLKSIYLSPDPFDIVAFDELDNMIRNSLYYFIVNSYYRNKNNELDFEKANGWGGSWIKEAAIEINKIIKIFEMIQNRGTRILISLHSQNIRFKDPMATDDYKKFVFDIPNRDDVNLREAFINWADYVLFGTLDVTISDKNRAEGNRRVLKTDKDASYAAKNRYGLPQQIEFKFSTFKELIKD